MLRNIAIWLIVLFSFIGCKKEEVPRQFSYLNLHIDGQEDTLTWETIESNWIDSLGKANMVATSYQLAHCKINLLNISDTGIIIPITLQNFYYTDGLEFIPDSISGIIKIVQLDNKGITGNFDLEFYSSYSGTNEMRIFGEFGIYK